MARGLIICWLPDPTYHPLWTGIYALLEPAAKLGGCDVLGDDELVWVAVEDGLIVAAITTRLLENGSAEVIHIGGAGMKDWFSTFEGTLCAWARNAGAGKFVARGRKGWTRVNASLGWSPVGMEDGRTLYEKVLN